MPTRLWYENMQHVYLTNYLTKPDSLYKNAPQTKILLLLRAKRPNIRRQTITNHPNKHQR